MAGLQSIIQGIFDFFQGAWNFFEILINNLKMLVEYASLAVTTSYNFIVSLPTYLQAFGYATVAITLLYLIIGRSTGGDD